MLPAVRTDEEWQAVVFDEKIVRPAGEDLAARLGLAGAGLRRYPGGKGYTTNLAACPDGTPVTAEFVISSYRQLWRIEKSFRMSKHDLKARPIYHRKRESIGAHLSIVFAALAVTRCIEDRTGWSIKRFVRTRPQVPHHPDPRRPAHPDRRRPDTT
jgi:transposase